MYKAVGKNGILGQRSLYTFVRRNAIGLNTATSYNRFRRLTASPIIIAAPILINMFKHHHVLARDALAKKV
jgi:hypothetical protein